MPLDNVVTLGATRATQISFTFDEDIQAVLGYDNAVVARVGVAGSFTAQQPLTDTTTPTSITVELPNLGGNILSYDGVSERRRNIVAVIPSMSQTNNNLIYDPGFPSFIDINNGYPIQVSKLDVRILSSFDDLPINLDAPGCSLTFGLQEP